jgi:hypothetical protein
MLTMDFEDRIDAPDIKRVGKFLLHVGYDFCYNCYRSVADHTGWACSPVDGVKEYDKLTFGRRFYAIDMFNNTWTPPTEFSKPSCAKEQEPKSCRVPEKKIETDHWKAWSHQIPGDCPCGIKKHLCEYHK